MTHDEAHSIAKAAAKEALHEMFMALGVDTNDATEVQKDMAFIRQWRESSEAVKRRAMIAAIGVIVIGLLGLIWTALKGG